MRNLWNRRVPLVLVLALGLGACATTGGDQPNTAPGASAPAKPVVGDPHDPLETFNRTVYAFNDDFDRAIVKPTAESYLRVVPAPIRRGIGNFFGNLFEPTVIVNDVLQGKIGQAAADSGRFLINSTLGLLGIFDVAGHMGLEKHNEDFGQTLGKWGFGHGPYLVLPFLGPSSVRDGLGLIPYYVYTNPTTAVDDSGVRWGATMVEAVDTRADLLGASRVLEQATTDPYVFLREAYLQKRRSLVYDGSPPREKFEED